MGKPILFMTHASYAGGVRASARQFDCHSIEVDELHKRDLSLMRSNSGGSLLANSFNTAWCMALNQQEEGKDIRWFVMLHDDVVPCDWWVRMLMEDLESSGADMVSAMVAIKDQFATTSTAISTQSRWDWQTRVTLAEAEKLPEVFTAADCGFPDRFLLANTGCWICRFDRPWKTVTDAEGNLKLFFTINDRIRRDDCTGKWRPDVEPEDWFFSRSLQELGGKVAVSRRVTVDHYGLVPFPNRLNGESSWGAPIDPAHADRMGYKPIGEEGERVNMELHSKEMADVKGWLNDDEGRLLELHATGKKVLEIGSYCGRSTIWMARVAESVLAVDTWDGRGTSNPRDTSKEFLENVTRYNVADKVEIAGGTITQVKRENTTHAMLGDFVNPDFGPFDFIFIDGGHKEPDVRTDITECLPLLASGGLMAFHDYGRATDPDVQKVVDELLLDRGAVIIDRAGSVVIIKVNNGGRETGQVESVGAAVCGTGPEDCGTPSETVANGDQSHFAAVCSW